MYLQGKQLYSLFQTILYYLLIGQLAAISGNVSRNTISKSVCVLELSLAIIDLKSIIALFELTDICLVISLSFLANTGICLIISLSFLANTVICPHAGGT